MFTKKISSYESGSCFLQVTTQKLKTSLDNFNHSWGVRLHIWLFSLATLWSWNLKLTTLFKFLFLLSKIRESPCGFTITNVCVPHDGNYHYHLSINEACYYSNPITHASVCDAATRASYHWITPLRWPVMNHSFLQQNKNRQWLWSLLLMNKLMATRRDSFMFVGKTSLLWSFLCLFCLLLLLSFLFK